MTITLFISLFCFHYFLLPVWRMTCRFGYVNARDPFVISHSADFWPPCLHGYSGRGKPIWCGRIRPLRHVEIPNAGTPPPLAVGPQLEGRFQDEMLSGRRDSSGWSETDQPPRPST